jgi:hypothetical protein
MFNFRFLLSSKLDDCRDQWIWEWIWEQIGDQFDTQLFNQLGDQLREDHANN